ncbi:MAG: bifunctional transaldolase/phosoglucose isomerase [Terracidiphilus sp.]|nr:bifunctional transaldolase/phosoglucose isomerase [Terracidiphilus sp.]MDR3777094.1 bifunctional transaldolase/phosoglucose isomerase [Terracidiphilus sp.]
MSYRFVLPQDLRGAVDLAAASWNANNNVDRFWKKDPSLWTSEGEEKWLGWIDIVERQQKDLAAFAALAADVKATGFKSVLLLGMGGSSLCPEVLSVTFGKQAGFPALHIVDSTDPVQVKAARDKVNLAETLVVVASKSGSTLEPNVLKQYFFEEMKKAVGADKVGSHFLAITDPGSKMEQVAKGDGFRHIFYGDPTIGGRFSALSNFGVVVATVAGLDYTKLLTEAAKAVASAKLATAQNPAVQLGLLMGTAANAGRDKITIFTSPEIYDLGAWMEQLIAESTGKLGKGITPVDREAIAAPEVYGKDRIFVYVRLKGTADASQDAKVAAIEAAGHPVIHIEIEDLYEIFGQFFAWEVATAVAGAVMGINPFNQPDVESAKIETRALTAAYEETGKLPERQPVLTDGGIKVYATESYAATLKAAAPGQTLVGLLRAHLNQIHAGDYFAALAYLPMFPEHEATIQVLRHKVRDAKRVATCLGFGPRFLHSTGQDYKGGPNTGVFLEITADHAVDVAIPGQKYSFGVVIDAQAAGDFAVLEARGRRAVRIHLGADVAAGLKTLGAAIDQAL